MTRGPAVPGRGAVLGVVVAAGVAATMVGAAGAVGVRGAGVVLAALLLVPVVHDVVARPMFRRLALRNAARRKGEAVLVVLGSLLGTAIITASMVVGDTITWSLRDVARTRLGPIDEVVEVPSVAELPAVASAVLGDPPSGTDGTVTLVVAPAAAANDDPTAPRAAPSVSVVELDFDAARALDPDPAVTGLGDAGPTPGAGEAVVNERLAGELGIVPGDRIRVFAYGYALPLEVRAVVPERGLAGYPGRGGVGPGSDPPPPVFVAPGTVEDYAGISLAPTASAPAGQLLVSNEGGVFDSHAEADRIVHELEDRVAGIGDAEVRSVKSDTLESAADRGASIEELYRGIGMFSVIAGVLLLVNLFVMLADERKVQLGMLRALGFRRNHLCRTFGIEGTVYAGAAAALGAIAGIAVGWVITEIAERIFSGDGTGPAFRLHVDPSSLVAGGLAGLAIALITIWATSIRIARLNVIAAIRDLPEPRRRGHAIRAVVLGSVGVAAGAALLARGLAAERPEPVMLGVPLAAFSAVPLAVRWVPRKPAVIGLAGVALAWTILVFSLFPGVMADADIPVFVLMGVLLVGAAVAIASQVDHLWVALNARLTGLGGGLSARLGLAYPLARKFRTGMLLGMYAIVIFTMTFMSAFIGIFGSQAPAFVRDVAAGYDVFVRSNPGNPVTAAELLDQPGVEAVAPLLYGFPDFRAGGDDGAFALTGFDESLLAGGGLGLDERDPAYATDRAVLDAVLADDGLAVVDDRFLQSGGGPPDGAVGVGDTLTVVNPSTGAEHELRVVGILGADFVFHGVLVRRELVHDFLGPLAGEFRHYVRTLPGADPDEVAAALTGRLVANGVDAESFAATVDHDLQQNESFFALIRGYLGLGLAIGIAGLGVVMVRAVRERRREIGMLRAMGFRARVVRRAFLVEAAFVAVQGSVIGIGLGLLTAYEVVVSSSTFGDEELPFLVPWFALAVVLVAPLLASLVAAAAPATQAARIEPAVALRIAE